MDVPARVKKSVVAQLYNKYGPVRSDSKRAGQRWYQELQAEMLRQQIAIQVSGSSFRDQRRILVDEHR